MYKDLCHGEELTSFNQAGYTQDSGKCQKYSDSGIKSGYCNYSERGKKTPC